jgi:ferrochelatase
MAFAVEPPYKHGTIAKTGIVLVNLGTPEAPTPAAVRSYLREFLGDPRVVEIPRALWWPILNGIILRTRPKASAQKYAAIWSPDGSPLRVHTERQAKLLQGYLGLQVKSPFVVEYAMRYGNPSIGTVLDKLKAAGCDRILVLPLYPQYAASTTATVLDRVAAFIARTRNVPEIRTVKHFHDHPAYIGVLGTSVREYWREHGRPDKLIMSFHGLPRYTLDRGDPYHCECQKTARLLAEDLELETSRWVLTFQSRFGRAEWLKPYTQPMLEELARQGARRVDVICPGFVSDCLETLEEINMECRAAFLESGGKVFHYIPCLNERDDWIKALVTIALGHLGGWVSTAWDRTAAQAAARASERRARALGAPE